MIGEYYRIWIERKKPPVVRAGLERDYKEHFKRYILPKFEDVVITELTPALLEAFRSYLLQERGLALKSVRNIINASFRAMIRDARRVDYLIEKNPFEALGWPRVQPPKPDPFTEEERDNIISYFRSHIPFYFPFVYTLFFTGMRPSEALALRWGDIDLRRGEFSVTKSRYMEEEGNTKTAGSHRQSGLLPDVVDVLRTAKPLHVTEDQHIFLNQEGKLLAFHTWRKKYWYRALRAKNIRERRPYCMRHTFISAGLTNGVNIKWLADYCGTSVAMIEKHYGKYIRNDSEEQLSRLLGVKSATLSATLTSQREDKQSQVAGVTKEGTWWAHLDSNQGPTGYEPVALTN
jgi:integrase